MPGDIHHCRCISTTFIVGKRALAGLLARPSIVVTRFPFASATGSEHERTGSPSTWTVQAPHCAMPQPYFVPVSPTTSRSAQSSGMSSGTFN